MSQNSNATPNTNITKDVAKDGIKTDATTENKDASLNKDGMNKDTSQNKDANLNKTGEAANDKSTQINQDKKVS